MSLLVETDFHGTAQPSNTIIRDQNKKGIWNFIAVVDFSFYRFCKKAKQPDICKPTCKRRNPASLEIQASMKSSKRVQETILESIKTFPTKTIFSFTLHTSCFHPSFPFSVRRSHSPSHFLQIALWKLFTAAFAGRIFCLSSYQL